MRVWAMRVAVLLMPGAAQVDTEAEARKSRSVAVLEAGAVPVLPSLPLIETEATSLRRSEAEVVERLIALAVGETGTTRGRVSGRSGSVGV